MRLVISAATIVLLVAKAAAFTVHRKETYFQLMCPNRKPGWTSGNNHGKVGSQIECFRHCQSRTCDAITWGDESQVCRTYENVIFDGDCNTLSDKPGTMFYTRVYNCVGERTGPCLAQDCRQIFDQGHTQSGRYDIFTGKRALNVYCDMETDNGGWTVFQRREAQVEDFHRSWSEYKEGFGDVDGEFWLGNDALHELTADQPMMVRFDLRHIGSNYFATYTNFSVESETNKYRMTVTEGSYAGDAGNSLDDPSPTQKQNGHNFSTYDQDNDIYYLNCAAEAGGFWYSACSQAAPNIAGNIEWEVDLGITGIEKTEIKIRPCRC